MAKQPKKSKSQQSSSPSGSDREAVRPTADVELDQSSVTSKKAAAQSTEKTATDESNTQSNTKPLRGPRAVGRFGIAVQVGLQIALAAIIFAQVNYVGCRRYERWDMTQTGRFTLSSISKGFLKGLDSDVLVVMAFMQNSDLFSEVEGMLTEYQRQGNDRLRVEVLDLSRNRDRLAELNDRHGIEFNRNMLAVISDDRVKVIGAEDLVRRSADGRVSEFSGEEILTSTLLEVAEAQQKKVYLLSGNRVVDELMAIGQQLTELAAIQNLRVESLSLSTANAIPTDAEAIVIAGPDVDLSTRELELIEDYWENRGGSLMVLLNPAASTPNLATFVRKRGIAPQDDRILSVANIPGLVSTGQIRDVPITFLAVRPGQPGTEITRELFGLAATMIKQTQSLKVFQDDALLAADGIKVAPLTVADQRFWGETEYRDDIVAASENQDNTGLLYTSAAAEKTPSSVVPSAGDEAADDASAKPSRLVVISNDSVLDPSGNTQKSNADFVMNSLNWLIDRSEMIGISPRKPTAYSLSITPAQFGLLQTLAIIIMPVVALALGGFIWFLRRR